MTSDAVSSQPGTIAAVVFDLGGVLVQWDPREAFRDELAADEIEPFLAEVDFGEWNKGLDAGRPMAEAEADIDRRFPHRAGVIAAYRRNFRSTLVGEVAGTADIVRELAAAGTRLVALTNWSAESFPHARELFPVLDVFEGIVVSGEEQVAKPDPQIFRLALERYGLAAASTAFVDDSAANVAATADLGLQAVRFVDAPTLRGDLAGLGLPLGPLP